MGSENKGGDNGDDSLGVDNLLGLARNHDSSFYGPVFVVHHQCTVQQWVDLPPPPGSASCSSNFSDYQDDDLCPFCVTLN